MTYIIQIDNEIRQATADEIVIIEAQQAETAKIEAERQAKENARAAVLTKLGLTADEAAALFGQ